MIVLRNIFRFNIGLFLKKSRRRCTSYSFRRQPPGHFDSPASVRYSDGILYFINIAVENVNKAFVYNVNKGFVYIMNYSLTLQNRSMYKAILYVTLCNATTILLPNRETPGDQG